MKRYIFASIKSWNVEAFMARRAELPGEWLCVTDPADLSESLIAAVAPRYVFFPHWSAKVPPAILSAAECVCFHMTDVPFGRGGSPLQNLILRGLTETKLSALRMTEEMDAGLVYDKRPLSLAGTAQEIFRRSAGVMVEMLAEIVAREPQPMPQSGLATIFKRRKPDDSLMPDEGGLSRLYDHIRMLDAATYPPAFMHYGEFRLEFGDAELDGAALKARVMITSKKEV